jgi:xanthine dehydrogenase YagS FAD-binding subunit
VRPFTYVRPVDETRALEAARDAGARFLAGGTTLVDLMRLDVMEAGSLIDLGGLPLASIEAIAPSAQSPAGGVRIGAMARNSDVAFHPLVGGRFPVLSQALLAGASPQLRNMATVGGNLLQRTRCSYFRDVAAPCNKRRPGSGCAALEGYSRMHAVLGGSDRCIAAHPSDMCVALVALDATVRVRGAGGERTLSARDFHTLPAERPDVESLLQPGELVTAVDVPASPFAARSAYVKVRDRASYAFALASAAVALEVSGGVVREVRVALGGVATKPWRSVEAERALTGRAPGPEVFERAATEALRDARPTKDNAFKVALAKRAIVRALTRAAGLA